MKKVINLNNKTFCYFCRKEYLKRHRAKKQGRFFSNGHYRYISWLQIHHVNENRKDNTQKNLKVVCGSCHRKLHYIYKYWIKTNFKK